MGPAGNPPNDLGLAARDLSAAIGPDGSELRARLTRIASHSPASGRYTVLDEVAAGAMGRVLRVRDEDLQRELAMKVVELDPGPASSPEKQAAHQRQLGRFVEEARITGQLDHPGIVPVHEIAVDEKGLVYFTMPLVRGRTLKHVFELVRNGQEGWNLQRALGVLHKVCLTVAFAHSKDVIHRDLKPDNIMVGPFGEAYVMDWGLALILGRKERRAMIGTPAYMSPEQATGRLEDVGPRSDVYSLGAILYELLGRRVPHELTVDQQPPQPMERLLAVPPRSLRELGQEAPPELVAICEKAMQAKPEERYGSVLSMADDLQAWLEGRVVPVYQSGSWARLRKWSQRNRGLSIALQALVLLFLVSVAVVLFQQQSKIREVHAQRTEALRSSYAANIAAADLALRAHDVLEAKRRLAACEEELRGWEWSHLQLRSDTSESVLRGHVAEIRSVDVSPDGRRIATASDDRTARVWNAGTGQPERTLEGHGDVVTTVRFSPDGRHLATGSQDKRVRIWEAETGELVRELEGHGAKVLTLTFSTNGDALASGDLEGTIHVWSLEKGEPTAELVSLKDPVHSLAYAPGRELLASGHGSGTVRMWEPQTGALLEERNIRTGSVRSLVFHPGGDLLAASNDHLVCLLRPENLETERWLEGHDGRITCLDFSPTGDTLLSGSFDKTIRLWDTSSGLQRASFPGHDSHVNAVAFHPDGEHFVSGSEDVTARLWNVEARAELTLEGHTDWVTSLSFRDDGRRLVTGSKDATLRIWEAENGDLTRTVPTPDRVDCLVLGPDDRIAFAGGDASLLRIESAAPNTDWIELRGGDSTLVTLAAHPRSKRLLARDWTGTQLWNLETMEALYFVEDPEDFNWPLAYHPGGATFATGFSDGEVRIRSASTGELLQSLPGDDSPVTALAYSPDGELLATAHGDPLIRVWATDELELVRELDGHESRVTSIAFSPDGRRLVSGSIDNTVRVWAPITGEALLTLRGHLQEVTAVAFGPRGDLIASASKDGTVRLWRSVASSQRP